ncbi:MAG: hypothetical protein II098_01345 [Treponema sp.]|nr:hypothetical protein [Treponema sp.]
MSNNVYVKKLFDAPLYEEIELDKETSDTLWCYFNGNYDDELNVDIYCPFCKDNTVLYPKEQGQIGISDFNPSKKIFNGETPFGTIHYHCARNYEHYFCCNFLFREEGKKIYKIGQFPSKANIDNPEYKKYIKVLPKEYLSDLKRAVGLASHGIGAGSFVYLRRVFEFLLQDAFERAKSNSSIDEDEYNTSRVVEKIKLVKDYLPSFMSGNTQTYGILSKGVHELSEEECLKHFELMKETIICILEEALEKKEKEERIRKLSAEINKVGAELSK